MRFDPMSVRPIPGKGQGIFSAVPTETESQTKERLTREETERLLARRAQLKEEIAELQAKLNAIEEGETE